MKGFFLPWNEREKQVKRGEKKLYLPKETLSLTDAAFDTHKPAYVSLPNPRGTLRSFLQAVESGKKDEAMGYFSERVAEVVDYEEMAGFLKDLKEYHCFLEDEGAGIRRVSVAKKAKRTERCLPFAWWRSQTPSAHGKFSVSRERGRNKWKIGHCSGIAVNRWVFLWERKRRSNS